MAYVVELRPGHSPEVSSMAFTFDGSQYELTRKSGRFRHMLKEKKMSHVV